MTNLTRIAAVGLVILAFILAGYAWLLSRAPAPVPETPVAAVSEQEHRVGYAVVVSERALAAGQILEAGMLRLTELPINPEGAFSTTEPLVGEVLKVDVGAGTPLTEQFLSRSLSLQLKENERAIGIAVDEIIGSGNVIVPGDFVDVFFTLKKSQELDFTQTRLLLSRIRVLAYGSDSLEGKKGNPQGRTAQDAQARSAVLAVPLEDVNNLLLASQSGRLQLVGRHPADEQLPLATLFREPEHVLPLRANLSAEERAALERPENKAFAGHGLPGFAGQAPLVRTAASASPSRRPATRPAPRAPDSTIEITRGTQSEKVNF